jgi:very-short-patch-repair endonuclease
MKKLTDLQGVSSKDVGQFFRLKTVKAFLINNPKSKITKRGKINGGTWVDNNLLQLFLQWKERKPINKYQRFENHFGGILSELYEGIEIIPQYKVNQYKVDWYIPSLNIVVEYDEEQHSKQKQYDAKREKIIKKELNCSFIRVKIDEEIKGLKEINKVFINKYINLSKFL